MDLYAVHLKSITLFESEFTILCIVLYTLFSSCSSHEGNVITFPLQCDMVNVTPSYLSIYVDASEMQWRGPSVHAVVQDTVTQSKSMCVLDNGLTITCQKRDVTTFT